MRKDEIIVKYVERSKASVSAIEASKGDIEDHNYCNQGTQNSSSYLCN